MHKTKDVLNALREKFGSDTKAAAAVGITQQSFSQWRRGDSYPSEENCKKIAELMGWKESFVIALVMAETARNPEIRELFRNMAKQFRDAAVVAAMALGAASFGMPSPAQAGNGPFNNTFVASGSEYALRRNRRTVRLLDARRR